MRTLLYILLILIVVLSVSLSVSIYRSEKAKQENDRLSLNIDQYGRAISTLTLTNSEIEIEMGKKNQTILESDSILKSKNRRISQLEQLVKTRIIIRDTDTVPVKLEKDPVQVPAISTDTTNQSQKYNFSETKSCVTIAGYIITKDSNTKLFVTERSSDIKVFDIYIKRKWYQIFRPKYERIVESNCGEVTIEKIYKKND